MDFALFLVISTVGVVSIALLQRIAGYLKKGLE